MAIGGKDLQKLKHRHIAIMEMMVQFPELTQSQIAEKLGYSPSRFSYIVNSPLFQMAFQEFRKRHQQNLSERVLRITEEALKASEEIIKDKNVSIPIKQITIRDILNLGHAKAVEKKASITATAELGQEALEQLLSVARELQQPFTPTKGLERTEQGEEGEEEV